MKFLDPCQLESMIGIAVDYRIIGLRLGMESVKKESLLAIMISAAKPLA